MNFTGLSSPSLSAGTRNATNAVWDFLNEASDSASVLLAPVAPWVAGWMNLLVIAIAVITICRACWRLVRRVRGPTPENPS